MVQSIDTRSLAGNTINERVFNLLEATNLNWSVAKVPLVSVNGTPTESFGIFRQDAVNPQWLGTVGKQYRPYQNAEMAQVIVEASEGLDIPVNRGGMLKGGKKVFLQAELPEIVIGKSGIRRWITCTNSHDGSTAISFGSANTRIICENTFARAYNETGHFRHTANSVDAVREAMKDLRRAMDLDRNLFDNFRKMGDVNLKDEMIERVIRKIFEVPSLSDAKVSSKKANAIAGFADALKTEVAIDGANLWSLFQGITRYTNHVAAPIEEEKKQDYLLSGRGYEISNMGFDEIMAIVAENTADPIYVMR